MLRCRSRRTPRALVHGSRLEHRIEIRILEDVAGKRIWRRFAVVSSLPGVLGCVAGLAATRAVVTAAAAGIAATSGAVGAALIQPARYWPIQPAGAGGRIPKRVRRGLTVEGWIGIGRGDVGCWCDHRSSGVCLCRRRGVGFRLLGRGGFSRCRVSRGLIGCGGIRLSLGGSCRISLGLCRGIGLGLRRRGGIGFVLGSRWLVRLGLRRGRCVRVRLRQRGRLGGGLLGGNRGRVPRGLLGYRRIVERQRRQHRSHHGTRGESEGERPAQPDARGIRRFSHVHFLPLDHRG